MNVKTIKFFLALSLAVVLSLVVVGPSLAVRPGRAYFLCRSNQSHSGRLGGNMKYRVECDQPVWVLNFCQAFADLPVGSGSNIKGRGGVVCNLPATRIDIDVDLTDEHVPIDVAYGSKRCINVDKCSLAVFLPAYSHCYHTGASGWMGIWNGYAQSGRRCW